MSDTTSLSSLESTSSVCDDLGALISQLEEIQEHHHNAIHTLQNLHQLINSHNNITVIIENVSKDFDEVLEKLHLDSLEVIKETGKSNFGSQLLKLLASQP